MGNDEELMRIAKKLEKITDRKDSSSAAQATDILKALQQMKITLDQIQKTRIGKIVNNLRKSIDDEDVSSLSKSLIRQWKKLLNEKDASNNNGNKSSEGADSTNGLNAESNQDSASLADTNNSQYSARLSSSSTVTSSTNGNDRSKNSSSSSGASSSSNTASQQQKRPPANLPKQTSFPSDTTNSLRLKCREMLRNALKPTPEMEDGSEAFYDAEMLASQIEDCIYKEFKDTNAKYKTRIRSRYANLNDKKNPDLKLNVLRGHIKPERIAVMTAEEMASDEMKQLRQKFTKEAINDAQMSVTSGTKTELIKCPNCKKNNCTYNQVQTRSADEPMTTFCYCNECGKRWKFC